MFTVNYHISCLDHPGHFIDSAATPRPTRPTVNCDDQWIPMDSCCYLQIGYWIYWMEIKVRFFLVMDCHAMSWVVLIADNIVIMSFCIQCLQFVWTCFFFSRMCFQFACKHCCNCFEGLFQIAESQNVSSEGLSGFNDWSSSSSEDINLNGGVWSLEWFLTVLVFQNGVREMWWKMDIWTVSARAFWHFGNRIKDKRNIHALWFHHKKPFMIRKLRCRRRYN